VTEFIQFIVLGLGASAVYTLLAQGTVLVYRGSGVVNFALGAFALSGAIVFTELRSNGVAVPLALLASTAVGALLGVLMQNVIMRPLRGAAPVVRIIATLGVLIAVQSAASLHYSDSIVQVEQFLPRDSWHVLGITVISDRVWLYLIAVAATVVLTLLQRWWLPAVATRAAADNDMAVSTLGWSPGALATGNWAAGCAFASLAGALIVPLTGLIVNNVVGFAVPALAAALLGRFDSFPKALLGATIIGVAQSLITQYWDQPGASSAVPLLIIILVLVVTGKGIPIRGHLTDRLPSLGNGRIRLLPALGAVVVAGLLMAFVFNLEWQVAFTLSIAYAVVLLSVVVLTGYAGQISLGQFAVAGMGALFTGRLVSTQGFPLWLAAIVGLLGAIPVGLVFALPALRTRGVTLAVVTLGLGVALEAMVFANQDYTGGAFGTPVAAKTTLFGWDINANLHPDRYGVIVIVAFAIAAFVVANLRRSIAGRRLIAIRENERAAASLGVGVMATKAYAFSVAAAIASLGGILVAFHDDSILYSNFTSTQSIYVVGLAVIGGLGYLLGPLVGSTLVAGGIASLFNGLLSGINDYLTLVGGVTIIVMLILNPDGVISASMSQWRWVASRFRPSETHARSVERRGARASDEPAAAIDRMRPQTLRVSGLTVRYGGVTAVDGAELTAEPGEIVGLIGPNGAGKTSFIDAVTGFAPVASGTIALNDTDIKRAAPHDRVAAGAARSWQSLELFEDVSVRENILVASDDYRWTHGVTGLVRPGDAELSSVALAAVEEFGLADDLDRLPGELSYGRRRLVGIARTVALSPSVLLLDEPAAGLSDVESRELGALVTRLAKTWGMSIVLVEHDVDLVMEICDRVVVLEFGKVIATGTPSEVRRDPAVLAAYLGTADAAGEEQVATI
jgi:sulfate-transporting ATPase